MKNIIKMSTFLFILLSIALVSMSAAITYVYQTSNAVSGNIEPAIIVHTHLTVNGTDTAFSGAAGDTVTLTATLDVPLSGVTITFKDGSIVLATQKTDVLGVASYSYQPSAGTHSWTATPST